jgi:metallophosphoesterase superfamily enzyme
MGLEPVPGEPAAVADCNAEHVLVVADYHAGIESGLRREGVELDSRAAQRRESILALLDRTEPDRLLSLGDLANAIGTPRNVEREEIVDLLDAVTDRLPVTLVKGNHDGAIEDIAG